jgi:serine protease Do
MTAWKTGASALALLGLAVAGAAVAPTVNGQTRARVVEPESFQVFSVGGSRIGISVADLDTADAKATAGVRIDSVEEESPAAKAGLQKGDVVVEFDGERVRSVRQFTRLVSETPAGRQVAAAVMRDGKRVSLNVTPRESSAFRGFEDDTWRALDEVREIARIAPRATPPRPPSTPRAPRPSVIEPLLRLGGNQLGVSVNSLSDQLRDYFGVKEGVLVTSVSEDSAASKAGVKAGDVIVAINGSSIDDPSDLRERMRDVDPGQEFTLGIVRDKKSMTLKGKAEESRSRRRTTRTIL